MKKGREGYKSTELGEIPEEWEVSRLGEISEITMGQSPTGDSYNSIGEGIPLLNGPTEFTNKYPIPKQWTIKPTKLCSKKDILFCVRGSSTGRMNIANDKYCIGRGVASIRGKEKYSKTDFIYQTMISNIDLILSFCEGSTFPNISRDNLNNLLIAFPPLIEQQKISLILSSIDEKIENTDKLIEKTKELKKGLMQRLLTKGIGHDIFKDTEIGRIPEEWEIRKMKDIIESTQLGTNAIGSNDIEKGIPMIKMGNLSIGGFNFDKVQYIKNGDFDINKEFVLKKGDFLFNTRNTLDLVGKSSTWNNQLALAIFNSNIMRIQYKIDIDSFYMSYYFADNIGWRQLKSIAKGTTSVGAIYTKDLINIKVKIPPLNEQVKIALILSSVDEKINQYESKKEKLQELKKGLMQKLLTGKIRVKV